MSIELFPYLAPGDTPRGTILLAHGFAEHHRRYAELTAALNDANYDVWAFDFTGHGTAPGKRAVVDVRQLIGEHLQARSDVLAQARTETMMLFGHSMGGLITLASTLLDPTRLDSVAVTGPALKLKANVPPAIASLGAAIGTALPMITTFEIDPALLTHDAKKVEEHLNDPYIYRGKTPLLSGATMAQQGYRVIENAPILAVPTLILHGDEDVLADVEGSLEFARRASESAEVQVITGAYHELLNEVERATYEKMIIDWYNRWR